MPNLGACGQCCIRSLEMPARTCGRRGGADTDLVATEQAFLLPIWSACCALTKSEVIYVCQLLFQGSFLQVVVIVLACSFATRAMRYIIFGFG